MNSPQPVPAVRQRALLPRGAPAGAGLLAATLLALAAWGAAAANAQTRASPAAPCDGSLRAQAFARTELYFGLSRPGGVVSEAEFQRFIDVHVTPHFPAGLTVIDGNGQFRDARGQVLAERSKVLTLLVPGSDRRASAKVEQIRAAYMRQFDQHSVLRADAPACVSFFPTTRTTPMTHPAAPTALASDADIAALVERATRAHVEIGRAHV